MGGVGLRPHHYPYWHEAMAEGRTLPWLEVMADNFLFHRGGPGLAHLDRIAQGGRCLVHGVGLSIASPEPLDERYVRELGHLCDRIRPHVVSDHLCFTRAYGQQSYDLLPIPFTKPMLARVAERVSRVQDILGRRFALENVSSYVSFPESSMSELEFLGFLCERTGCGILLDVNNVYVSACNHGHDAQAELLRVNPEHVMQFHVAGHSAREGFLHDTHDRPVCDEVWSLCASALAHVGLRPFILENDDDEVSAEVVVAELEAGLARMRFTGLDPTEPDLKVQADSRTHGARLREPVNTIGLDEGADADLSLLQREFLDCVQSIQPPAATLARTGSLGARLAPATREHFDAYRLGYFSRVTTILAGTLFEKASTLLSTDYVRGVLGRFREAHPATHPSLTSSCEDVPEFAEGLEDVRAVPWLPDFLRLCLARWKVLVGPDPLPAPAVPFALDVATLQRSSVFLRSAHPIYSLWRLAETKEGIEEGVDSHPQAVLLFKSSATDLDMIHVESSLVAFVLDISLGRTVLQAIEALDARGDDVDASLFGAFLAALSQRNAWISA